MGFLNGLSALGASTAQFAATAGLEQQKADLAKQSLTLADQLAGARESAGRQETGAIASAAADKLQAFQAGQTQITEAGATARSAATNQTSLGVANIAAKANEDLSAAQAQEAKARASLTTAQTDKVNTVTGLQQNIADEQAKPSPDPSRIKSLTNQVTAFSTDAQSQAAIGTSLASLAASAQLEMSRLTQQRDTELNTMNGIQYDDVLKAQKQAAVDALNQQIRTAQTRSDYLNQQAGSFVTNRANVVLPANPAAPNADAGSAGSSPRAGGIINTNGQTAPAPTDPATVLGSTGSTTPTSTAAASVSADPTTAPKPAPGAPVTAPPRLPGDTGNTTNIDALKAARPDLNFDALKGKSPALVGLVMQMVDGRATLPPLGSRSPDAIQLRAAATLVDPTLDEASSKARIATRVDFTSGAEARSITALNTALGHAGVVADAFEKLNNGRIPLWNTFGNAVRSDAGQAEFGNAQQAVNALAAEARKVFAGNGGGNLAELESWEKSFPLNGSQGQQKGALNQFVNLLDSRLQSLGDQYNRGMGVTRDPMTFLEAHARNVMQQLTGTAPNVPIGNQLGTPPQSGIAPAPSTAPSARPPLADILKPPQ